MDSPVNELKEKEIHSSYPYLILSFTGIDFFGGLIEKFLQTNSKNRSGVFINKWMSKVDSRYEDEDFGHLIYSCCRCGIFHNAVLKKYFGTSSYNCSDKHLYISLNRDFLYIDSKQFANDFIEAQKKFREALKSEDKDYIQNIFDNLSDMMKKNQELDVELNSNFNNLTGLST